jgi:hypothetical protein
MGMSGDFEIAIEEGATVVRVGQAIFGARACRTAITGPPNLRPRSRHHENGAVDSASSASDLFHETRQRL